MSCIISEKGEISRVFSTVNTAITGFWGRPKVFANFEQIQQPVLNEKKKRRKFWIRLKHFVSVFLNTLGFGGFFFFKTVK